MPPVSKHFVYVERIDITLSLSEKSRAHESISPHIHTPHYKKVRVGALSLVLAVCLWECAQSKPNKHSAGRIPSFTPCMTASGTHTTLVRVCLLTPLYSDVCVPAHTLQVRFAQIRARVIYPQGTNLSQRFAIQIVLAGE
jgi:hypothetical protein